MLIRIFLAGLAASTPFGAISAEESAPVSISQVEHSALLAQHFPGASIPPDSVPTLPTFRVADFDVDGRMDLLLLYTDAESAKRGPGCYGIGVIRSYQEPSSAEIAFQHYNCIKEYTVEIRESIPISISGVERISPLRSPRACIRLILKYGDRDFVCYGNGQFHASYSTPRIQAPSDQPSTR